MISLLFLMGLSTVEFNEKACVADANQAIAIAEKEFIRVYGEKVKEERPFVAKQVRDSVWTVKGTFYNNLNKTRRGGVAYAEINGNNCKILKIIHGK
ncbi:MAG: hypothetical protein RL427_1435 [Bacteroidota bacterium]